MVNRLRKMHDILINFSSNQLTLSQDPHINAITHAFKFDDSKSHSVMPCRTRLLVGCY